MNLLFWFLKSSLYRVSTVIYEFSHFNFVKYYKVLLRGRKLKVIFVTPEFLFNQVFRFLKLNLLNWYLLFYFTLIYHILLNLKL